VNEIDLFEACLIWAKQRGHSPEAQRAALGSAIGLIRFRALSAKQIVDVVCPYGLLTTDEESAIFRAIIGSGKMPAGFSNHTISRGISGESHSFVKSNDQLQLETLQCSPYKNFVPTENTTHGNRQVSSISNEPNFGSNHPEIAFSTPSSNIIQEIFNLQHTAVSNIPENSEIESVTSYDVKRRNLETSVIQMNEEIFPTCKPTLHNRTCLLPKQQESFSAKADNNVIPPIPPPRKYKPSLGNLINLEDSATGIDTSTEGGYCNLPAKGTLGLSSLNIGKTENYTLGNDVSCVNARHQSNCTENLESKFWATSTHNLNIPLTIKPTSMYPETSAYNNVMNEIKLTLPTNYNQLGDNIKSLLLSEGSPNTYENISADYRPKPSIRNDLNKPESYPSVSSVLHTNKNVTSKESSSVQLEYDGIFMV
jgi:hypothetical protein